MPYNPQIAYTGDQYLFSGLSNLGRNVRNYIGEKLESNQQKDELTSFIDTIQGNKPARSSDGGLAKILREYLPAGKSADQKRDASVFKALQDYAKHEHGVDKANTTPMSLPQLRGYVRGLEYQALQNQQNQRSENLGLQNELLRQNLQQTDQDNEASQLFNAQRSAATVSPRLGAVVSDLTSPKFKTIDLGEYANLSPKERPAPDPEAIQRFMSNAGIGPEKQARLVEALKAFGAFPTEQSFKLDSLGKPNEIPGLPGHYFIPTSKGGGQILSPKAEKLQPQFANDSWLYSDDKEEFTRKLMSLPDNETRQAVLEYRRLYKIAMGSEDPLAELLKQFVKPESKDQPAPGNAKTPKVKRYNPQTGRIE